MNYDPNLTCSGRMAKQKVQLTFQQWEYSTVVESTVGGNCTGLSVIDCAIANAYDALELDGQTPMIEMTNHEGNTLGCTDDEDRGDDFLKDMLVKAEIICIEPSA